MNQGAKRQILDRNEQRIFLQKHQKLDELMQNMKGGCVRAKMVYHIEGTSDSNMQRDCYRILN